MVVTRQSNRKDPRYNAYALQIVEEAIQHLLRESKKNGGNENASTDKCNEQYPLLWGLEQFGTIHHQYYYKEFKEIKYVTSREKKQLSFLLSIVKTWKMVSQLGVSICCSWEGGGLIQMLVSYS